MPHPILLYDGVCRLCNRMNQFVLRRDPEGIFRFASLQSALAGRILARAGGPSLPGAASLRVLCANVGFHETQSLGLLIFSGFAAPTS